MRFLSSLFAFLLVALVAACSPKTTAGVTPSAGTNPAPAPAAAPATAPTASNDFAPTLADTALLWRISGNGLAQESFVFGTIHMIPTEDYFLPTGMVAALNDADKVVFEIDPKAMEDPTVMMSLMSKINMRGDTSLQDLLPAEDYKIVSDYFTKLGLPMFMAGRMKPMFLSAMVGQDMESLQNGMTGENSSMKSYELEMSQLAQKAGKPVDGLETIEFQLGLFDEIPYSAQAKMLVKAVRGEAEGGEASGELEKVVALYKRKAIAEMGNMVKDDDSGMADFEELLLTKRNRNWIPAMREMMPTGTKLFAVGAAHLGGDQGVIALLREAGYSVEPVYE